VTEDVTGPLAESINHLAIEFSQVLLTIRHIGEQMESTSVQVKQQNEALSQHQLAIQEVVNSTSSELSATYDAILKIADVTQSCHQMAEHAIHSNEKALNLIAHIPDDLEEIRETMHLLAKQIQDWDKPIQKMKRLVALMQYNAQRLQFLASNQPVKASEASETIEWLHWLVEFSIPFLSQLSERLSNLEMSELDEAMTIMNKLIRQEVEAASLGERASEQIKVKPTAKVLPVLAQITVSSKQQAQISQDLQEQTNSIQESSQETLKELETQIRQAENLVAYAQEVIKFIQLFKLPAH
jgi:twitching motility protein PilJ